MSGNIHSGGATATSRVHAYANPFSTGNDNFIPTPQQSASRASSTSSSFSSIPTGSISDTFPSLPTSGGSGEAGAASAAAVAAASYEDLSVANSNAPTAGNDSRGTVERKGYGGGGMGGLGQGGRGGAIVSDATTYINLPAMLRECAIVVERDDFHPVLYQTLGLLHRYAGENATAAASGSSAASTTKEHSEVPMDQKTFGVGVTGTRISPTNDVRNADAPDVNSGGNSVEDNKTGRGNVASYTNGTGNAKTGSSIGASAPGDDDPSAPLLSHLFKGNPTSNLSNSRNISGGGGASSVGSNGPTPHNVAKDGVKFLGKFSKKAFQGIQSGASKLANGVAVASDSHFPHQLHQHQQQQQQHGIDGKSSSYEDEVQKNPNHYGNTDGNDWCEEHFIMGCQCKKFQGQHNADQTGIPASASGIATKNGTSSTSTQLSQPDSSMEHQSKQHQQQSEPSSTHSTSVGTTVSSQQQKSEVIQSGFNNTGRPCFQRPINPKSNLIANGWIEQQRRSKMRVVWKDILASLVEGRRHGEETTLWIQRQVTTAVGKQELEALHQIPMKWIEDVTYLDFYGDYRFALKIYNVADEFQFRTRDEESAQHWVATLKSAVDATLSGRKMQDSGGVRTGGKSVGRDTNNTSRTAWGDFVPAGVEQGDKALNGTLPASGSRAMSPNTNTEATNFPGSQSEDNSHNSASSRVKPLQEMTIKELRALAHSVGIDTRGMERADLERIASQFQQNETRATSDLSADEIASVDERRRQQLLVEQRALEDRRRREIAEQHASEQRRIAEQQRALAERKRLAELRVAEEHKRMAEFHAAEESRKIEQRTAEERKRFAELQALEERKRQQQLAEHLAAEERRRVGEQQAAEQRRRLMEQKAAEQRRQQFEDEERRKQAEQQQNYHRQQQEQWKQQTNFSNQPPLFPGQSHQHEHRPQPPFSANGSVPPPSSQNAASGGSTINQKYANAMAERSEDEEQAAISKIKRNILINWALQPPMLNSLRPIDQLICSIHNVFPPAFGVPAHLYFKKWKPIQRNDLVLSSAMGRSVNDEKLKKAVKQIRFFLHPDKLPKDLNSDQQFMCKMLWDVTSDAWEEFCSKNEELDWIRS